MDGPAPLRSVGRIRSRTSLFSALAVLVHSVVGRPSSDGGTLSLGPLDSCAADTDGVTGALSQSSPFEVGLRLCRVLRGTFGSRFDVFDLPATPDTRDTPEIVEWRLPKRGREKLKPDLPRPANGSGSAGVTSVASAAVIGLLEKKAEMADKREAGLVDMPLECRSRVSRSLLTIPAGDEASSEVGDRDEAWPGAFSAWVLLSASRSRKRLSQ